MISKRYRMFKYFIFLFTNVTTATAPWFATAPTSAETSVTVAFDSGLATESSYTSMN